MIYYCIYKDECLYKNCVYRQAKSKFSAFRANKDLTINEFTCSLTGKKRVRLISDERIICSRYKECGINCSLKTSYITINNLESHFGYKFYPPKRFRCDEADCMVTLQFARENIGSYTSIWN